MVSSEVFVALEVLLKCALLEVKALLEGSFQWALFAKQFLEHKAGWLFLGEEALL